MNEPEYETALPLVKVVVTSYNRRVWAQQGIASVFAQTYPNLHVVIVDDASTDGSADLARDVAAGDPARVTVIAKASNRGLRDSIRLGLEAGPDADYVAFLNEDDFWEPDKLTRQIELFQRDSSLRLVYCEARIVDENSEPTGDYFSTLTGGYPNLGLEEILKMCRACASTFVITREVAAVAARDLIGGRAWDFWLLLLAVAQGSIANLDEPLASYRVTSGAMHFVDESWINRDMTICRDQIFREYPILVERFGGQDALTRRLGLDELNLVVWEARNRRWRHFFWHARWVWRARQPRLTAWLIVHAIRALLDPVGGDVPLHGLSGRSG